MEQPGLYGVPVQLHDEGHRHGFGGVNADLSVVGVVDCRVELEVVVDDYSFVAWLVAHLLVGLAI